MSDLDRLQDTAAAPAATPLGLPFSSYRSAEVFEAEMAAWRKDWVAVCAASAVADPGDVYPTTVGLEPVLVMRGADGELRAFSNACSHRGTLLVDEPTNERRIQCPYHAWTYADDGALVAVPYDEDDRIDKAAHCLTPFQVGIWHGAVFVNLDATAAPLADRFDGIDPWLEPYRPERFDTASSDDGTIGTVWEANWKFVLENAMESYHLFRVHPETLEPYSPTRDAFHLEGSARWTTTAGATSARGEADPTLPEFAQDNYTLVSLPPSLVGVYTATSWGFLIVEPLATNRTNVKGGSFTVGPVDEETAAMGAAFTAAFLDEDQWICERNQRGIEARHNEAGSLVALERVVGDFHQWINWQVFGAEPEPSWRLAEPI